MNTVLENMSKENSQNQNQSQSTLSAPLLITATIISVLLAIASSLNSVRHLFENTTEERKILSKVFTEYDHKSYVILKIKINNAVELEIYEKNNPDNSQLLKQKFILNDDSEAFLMVNSSALNLALIDVNKDGLLDIVCPTVDKNGNSRLNVFQYNSDIEQFLPYNALEN